MVGTPHFITTASDDVEWTANVIRGSTTLDDDQNPAFPLVIYDGDTWTYNDESKMGGQLVKSRFVMQQQSPTSYTFKWETEGEGGAWMTLVEGKAKKAS